MDAVQTSGGGTVLDGSSRQTDLTQLRQCQQPVLPPREIGDRAIKVESTTPVVVFVPMTSHAPIVPQKLQRVGHAEQQLRPRRARPGRSDFARAAGAAPGSSDFARVQRTTAVPRNNFAAGE
ncbi:MAG TPA: hypothetical protein VGY32_09860 [Solirubrobacteraceae bacterium]|nr:hypothetical protein [Solirubrobacteraceae bacterium]